MTITFAFSGELAVSAMVVWYVNVLDDELTSTYNALFVTVPGATELTTRKLYVYGEFPPPEVAVSVWNWPTSNTELLVDIVGVSELPTVIVFAASIFAGVLALSITFPSTFTVPMSFPVIGKVKLNEFEVEATLVYIMFAIMLPFAELVTTKLYVYGAVPPLMV